ncbi:MAG: hypothetical protein RLZZ461_1712 [Planctomycetota bacterium]
MNTSDTSTATGSQYSSIGFLAPASGRSTMAIVGATLLMAVISSASVAGDGVILQAANVGCTQGQVGEVQIRATTVGLVGGFGFNASTGSLTASDVRYDGPIFDTSWQGWDSAPSSDTRVDAVCVFTEDQVDPGDHTLVTIEVPIPADLPAGTVIPVTLSNVQFFNYDFSIPSLEPVDGSITIYRTADLDGDGTVGSGDMGLLLAAWGKASPKSAADLNADGHVNGADLGRLVDRWSTEG